MEESNQTYHKSSTGKSKNIYGGEQTIMNRPYIYHMLLYYLSRRQKVQGSRAWENNRGISSGPATRFLKWEGGQNIFIESEIA